MLAYSDSDGVHRGTKVSIQLVPCHLLLFLFVATILVGCTNEHGKQYDSNGSAGWEEELALELRIAGVPVENVEDTPVTLIRTREGERSSEEIRQITLFCKFGGEGRKINPESDRGQIEITVKRFLASHPGIGSFDCVSYMDDRATMIKICDL